MNDIVEDLTEIQHSTERCLFGFQRPLIRRRRGSRKRPGPAVADDLVLRDFSAERPDEVWLTDITEHPTGEGKLYVCAAKDVCSRRIVGWAIG